MFISEHARRYNVQPIITFDQPLWWKAFLITATEPANSDLKDIVLCLGGFHTEMSFLGCIGHLMGGSGLQELFELIYAPNAVIHMLAGKAIARAVRAHLFIESALNALLFSDAMNINVFSTSENDHESSLEVIATNLCSKNSDLQEAFVLYENLMNNSVSVHQVCQSEIIQKLKKILETKVCSLQSSRTASLWLQYLKTIDILRNFIRAQRTGNWELLLQTLSDMLPYLAASGHNNYTKCVWVYLQQMSKLETEHPTVYRHFIKGLHVVRRSDRLWAGLSTDLVIEQALMRTLKTTGGLTRGRGMTEQQRLTWVMAMPACAQVNKVMQDVTGINYNTGEQNKDMSMTRQDRDWKDTNTVLRYLSDRNPFISDIALHNISTGVHAHSSVDVDHAESVGRAILDDMKENCVMEYTFRKKN